MFQDVVYARLGPVRYMDLNHRITGLCVSSSWLVVTDGGTVRLYSLPGVELHDQLTALGCHHPRADSDGVLYVPYDYYITVWEITKLGKLREIRTLSSVGGQSLWWKPSVAVGPQKGQLCVGQLAPPSLWIIKASDGSLLHTLTLPDQCDRLYSVAALDSGQLMIYYRVKASNASLAVYRSVTDSPTLLPNLTTVLAVVGDWVERRTGLTGSGNRFLAPYQSDVLVLGPDGSMLHTVDAVSGKLGIWLHEISDVAVWQDCVWLGGYNRDLVLLCSDRQ